MAEILKARDLGQPGAPIVAVKRILPHLTEDRQYVTMFLDESRVLAQLEHDNVIRTLAVGQVDETPFIALEFVFGPDARMVFHKSRRAEQPIPMSIACYVMAQVCAALHYAHERHDDEGNPLGLVHRDVSLQNVLLSYDGAVKLTDFGIAKSGVNVARTEAGVVKGKFGYMAPEQVMSQPMDRRSDVFSAGICLYELLTGERLFSGDSDYAAVERVRNVRIEPPSRYNRMIPSTLEAIVMKALAKAPRDRFQTAGEMRRALLAFMAESAQECSARQLGQYLRTLFADELARRPSPDSLRADAKPVVRDPTTGLAVFDDLDAPGGSREAQAEQAPQAAGDAAPSSAAPDGEATRVEAPPAADLAASAAPQAGASEALPDADPWPEPSFASNAGAFGAQPGAERRVFEPGDDDRTQVLLRDALVGAGDDEVTRQIFVGQALSASPRPVAEPQAAPAVARPRDSQRPPRAERAPMPFEQVAATPYGLVIAVVTTILAVIVLTLLFARGARPATVHVVTLPPSPEVLVDGRPVKSHESPFVIDGLKPEVDHLIEVRMPGFQSWSTRLVLEPGQSLALPLVTLVPSAALQKPRPSPRPAPQASASVPKVRATPAPAPSPAAPKPPTSTNKPATRNPPHEASRPRKEPEPPSSAASAQAFGTLRINSRPWSTVTVDGKRVGNTPLLDLRVSPGTHVLELHNPELRLKKKLSLRVRAGQTVTRVVSLP